MGEIPAQNNMVSSILVFPKHNDVLAVGNTFDIKVQVANLAAGSFTNPQSTYYAAPQELNGGGNIIGHTHVTVQDLGNSLNPTQALDASRFVFFKGINDAGNNGLLSATVTGGLPAGNYRVCTMSSASNHQPVLMPVAQRGAQDDCQKFTVTQGGDAGGGGAANNAADGSGTGATDPAAGGGDAGQVVGGQDGGNATNTNSTGKFRGRFHREKHDNR